MSFLYILKNTKFNRNYTGVTEDVETRLKKHNDGKVRSTKAWRPWVIVHMEEYATLGEAKKREWFLKCTPQGSKEKKKILENAGIPAKGLGKSEGLDPDEFDEDERPACVEASAGREELADLL